MSGHTVMKPPATNAQWARDIEHRLQKMESPLTARIGDWVLSTQNGALVATAPDRAMAVLSDPLTSLGDLSQEFVSAKYVTQREINLAIGNQNGPLTQLQQFIQNIPIVGDLVQTLTGVVGGTLESLATNPFLNSLIPGLHASQIIDGSFPLTMISGLLDTGGQIVSDLLGNAVADLTSTYNAIISALGGVINTGLAGVQNALQNIPAANIVGALINQFMSQFSQYISVGQIGQTSPELLANPTYNGSNSVQGSGVWIWDGAVTRTADGSGSVKVVASGLATSLLNDPPIPCGEGQTLTVSHWLMWSGATGTGPTYRLGINYYDDAGTVVGSPVIASVSSPASSSSWTQLSGTSTVPAGATYARLRLDLTAAATAGTIHWDDGSVKGTGLMPQSYVFNLPTSLSDLWGRAQDIVNAAWEGITGAVAGGAVALNTLKSVLGAIPQANIFGLSTALTTINTNMSALVTNIQNAFAGASAAGNAVTDAVHTQLTSFLGSIQQGLTGAVNAGVQQTQAAVQGTLTNVAQNVAIAQQGLADLLARFQPKQPALVLGGSAPALASAPTGWGSNWVASGSASASATVVDKGYSLVKSGNSPRTLIEMNVEGSLAGATKTDYQSIRFLMNTIMESPLAGGSGNAGNGLVFRADSTSNPQNYGELRFYYDKIELHAYVSGVKQPTIKTWSVTPSWGVTYSLDCGTAAGLNKYQLYANGTPIDTVVTDSSNYIGTGSGQRFGGQKMYTDTRGATETAPGVVGYWKLSDNSPTQKLGSGFKVCRVNTTAVSFSAGASSFPANFYDTVDNMTPDYAWDAPTSTITVRDEGYYTFTIGFPYLAPNGTYNIYGGVAVAIAVDGVLHSFGGPPANAGYYVYSINYSGFGGSAISDAKQLQGPCGNWWTSPPIYCQAGSQVQPVYSTAGSLSISGGYGTQTVFERATQYFAGTKIGQVVA